MYKNILQWGMYLMYENVKLNAARKKDINHSSKQKHTNTMLMKSQHPEVIIQRLRKFPQSFGKSDAIVLQRTIGNKAVCKLLSEIGLSNGNSATVKQEALPNKAVPLSKDNNTGLPDNLKVGVENLSGLSMDNVRVHYNSSKPAQVGALAYTQGTDIYVAPGQEKHLAHEVWHVVQQTQGRVKPTMQIPGAAVNDDAGLEREASEMGKKALQHRYIKDDTDNFGLSNNQTLKKSPIIQGRWLNITELSQDIYYYIISTTETPKRLISGRIIQGYNNQQGTVVLIERQDGSRLQLNAATLMFTLDIKDALRQFPGIKIMETGSEDQVANIAQKSTVQAQNMLRIHSKFLSDPRVRDFVSRICKQRLVVNERKEPIQRVVLASYYGAPLQSWAILQAPLVPGPLGAPNPPGWIGNAHPHHHQRSHLIGGQFGAPKTLNNLVTLTDGSNHPGMSVHENILATAIANNPAHVFLYDVTTDNAVFAATNAAGNPTVATPAPQGVMMDAMNLTTGIPVLQGIYIPNNIFQNHAGCID